MVVEDEGISAMSIRISLEEMGYDVTSLVSSGEDAVKKTAEDNPDLILMDITLIGEMDGIEAAGQIYSQFNIPVVYITAHSDKELLKRIKKTKPFGYIVKPFEGSEIRIAVELALYKHQIEEKLRQSEKELRNHKERLEETVIERTTELTSAIELLRQEIDDRRMAEAESLRASHLAAIGEMAAGVAHEINNPINGIINYAQILINKNGPDSEEQDIAGRIIKESDRIANIVKNLLSFARESEDVKQPVNIEEIISASLALTEAQLRKCGINLQVVIQEGLSRVMAKPQQLVQVVLNVISNARHAFEQNNWETKDVKMIKITAEEIPGHDPRHIVITFYDNGSGIAAGIMNKIMIPFFTTKPEGKGTGLGLSISHGIIKDHGGGISVNSAEGEFTEVAIKLPVL
jgi:signal transduction histidine kinase